MDVIALVGPSGTGKSHRALMVAKKHGADAIIDDGILIKDGKIVAGSSAKKEQSKIMAVRRAIFVLPGHADEVAKAIEREQPKKILILGTSDNMVQKIAKILRLPPISEIVRIEDIATKAEMAKAQFYRLKEGKHIIPVPTIELKPHFSQLLIDPLQSFFRGSRDTGRVSRKVGEKSIVRPMFSYYGKLIIDDSAIKSIVQNVMKARDFINKIGRIRVSRIKEGGEDKGINISCEIVLTYGNHIPTLLKETQARVRDAVEYMTGMLVREINIMVKTLYVAEA